MVSAEPFSHGSSVTEQRHYGACRRKWRLTLICVLVARPRRCLTLLNPVPWQNWMAVYLGYTLWMKTPFRGWPVMAHETHTRRRRLQCSQLTLLVCNECYQSQSWRLRWTAGRPKIVFSDSKCAVDFVKCAVDFAGVCYVMWSSKMSHPLSTLTLYDWNETQLVCKDAIKN